MAILPTIFLEATLRNADEHGLEVHLLAANKGLILFAGDIDITEQGALLRRKAAELEPSISPPGRPDPQTDQQRSPRLSPLDCQVTVEERTQLFKFLSS